MTTKNNIALFIDADNAPAQKIDSIMDELMRYGTITIRKIYGNWKSDHLKQWEAVLLAYALQPVQQFAYTKGKNATDMCLTIDVMDILHRDKADIFAIVSSDCDFTPLVIRIKADGKQVIGFGEQKTPLALVRACSNFSYLDIEYHAVPIQNPVPPLNNAIIPDTPKNPSPASTNPTLSTSESQIKATAAELKPATKTQDKVTAAKLKCDTALMNLLRDGIANAKDETGWANLGKIGSFINNQSSFNSKNYGYTKLSDLIRAIDIFETKLEKNNNQLLVKDKRVK